MTQNFKMTLIIGNRGISHTMIYFGEIKTFIYV